jgi:hypothetical protein
MILLNWQVSARQAASGTGSGDSSYDDRSPWHCTTPRRVPPTLCNSSALSQPHQAQITLQTRTASSGYSNVTAADRPDATASAFARILSRTRAFAGHQRQEHCRPVMHTVVSRQPVNLDHPPTCGQLVQQSLCKVVQHSYTTTRAAAASGFAATPDHS